MSQYLVDEIRDRENISVRLGTVVEEVGGEENVESVTVKDTATGETETLPAAALFVFIGAAPRTDWLEGVVKRDDRGFVLTGPDLMGEGGERPEGWPLARDPYLLETSVPGIFAAGDVRHESVKRVASGVGEGGVAIQFVHRYLAKV